MRMSSQDNVFPKMAAAFVTSSKEFFVTCLGTETIPSYFGVRNAYDSLLLGDKSNLQQSYLSTSNFQMLQLRRNYIGIIVIKMSAGFQWRATLTPTPYKCHKQDWHKRSHLQASYYDSRR